jgi:hypothetical protein
MKGSAKELPGRRASGKSGRGFWSKSKLIQVDPARSPNRCRQSGIGVAERLCVTAARFDGAVTPGIACMSKERRFYREILLRVRNNF